MSDNAHRCCCGTCGKVFLTRTAASYEATTVAAIVAWLRTVPIDICGEPDDRANMVADAIKRGDWRTAPATEPGGDGEGR